MTRFVFAALVLSFFGVIQSGIAQGPVIGLSPCEEILTTRDSIPKAEKAMKERDKNRFKGIPKEGIGFKEGSLFIDGEKQGYLYGGDFQPFRLRTQYGPNADPEAVYATWAKGLDLMSEAGMNSLSLYIPWDFFNPAKGVWDFDGTLDLDGDGRADYPARNIHKFFQMAEERGIRILVVRPGPHINAEWGPMEFGAIPKWFHEEYPQSHMLDQNGGLTRQYDFHNKELLEQTEIWFKKLHDEVLVKYTGKGKPIKVIQLDNETNYQWQAVKKYGYGDASIAEYRYFLQTQRFPGAKGLENLNQAHGRKWKSWSEVDPRKVKRSSLAEDQDWYQFQDYNIVTFQARLRSMWEDLGYTEPKILFMLAQSYNVLPGGMVPNPKLGNQAGMAGYNGYFKTYQIPEINPHATNPFKSIFDILVWGNAAGDYVGAPQDRAFTLEMGAGWWKGTNVTEEGRRHAYLNAIMTGVWNLNLYYLHEGYNWEVDYLYKMIKPDYDLLRSEPAYAALSDADLLDHSKSDFWISLKRRVDEKSRTWSPGNPAILADINLPHIMNRNYKEAEELTFETPIDKDGNPTKHYAWLEQLGKKVFGQHGDFLSDSQRIADSAVILQDATAYGPGNVRGVDSGQLHTSGTAGLLGMVMQTGLNPTVENWSFIKTEEGRKKLFENKVIFLMDSGNLDPELSQELAGYVERGGTVVSFLGDSVAGKLGLPQATKTVKAKKHAVKVSYQAPGKGTEAQSFDALGSSVGVYNLRGTQAEPILRRGDQVVGYQVAYGKGRLIQSGVNWSDIYDSPYYALIEDGNARTAMIQDVLAKSNLTPKLRISEKTDRITVTGRVLPSTQELMINVASYRRETQAVHVLLDKTLISEGSTYRVTNVLTGTEEKIKGRKLLSRGLSVKLGNSESAVFSLQVVK